MSVLLAFLLAAAPAAAADAPKAKPHCRTCHTTDTPTKEKPSLVRCPRKKESPFHALDEAVKTVVFPAGGGYGRVAFAHSKHAEMAEMDGGCVSCHHYNQASAIQKCADCHSAERRRDADALTRPDLRGARHRLCLTCHRQEGGKVDCATCHETAGKAPAKARKAVAPERVVFALPGGKKVVLPHKAHAADFGAACAACHKKETCAACHGPERSGAASVTVRVKGGRSREDAHRSCAACHDANECAKCHQDGG
ncbi:MAG: cytochrome c3 family protein [Elusimicrobia bacterium]|nr:cytochrome c3 family protein [Elusimicrobiota bacterium]